MCLSSVYKEKALGDNDMDVIYLNGWVAVYQFMASLLFAVPSAYAIGLPVSVSIDGVAVLRCVSVGCQLCSVSPFIFGGCLAPPEEPGSWLNFLFAPRRRSLQRADAADSLPCAPGTILGTCARLPSFFTHGRATSICLSVRGQRTRFA